MTRLTKKEMAKELAKSGVATFKELMKETNQTLEDMLAKGPEKPVEPENTPEGNGEREPGKVIEKDTILNDVHVTMLEGDKTVHKVLKYEDFVDCAIQEHGVQGKISSTKDKLKGETAELTAYWLGLAREIQTRFEHLMHETCKYKPRAQDEIEVPRTVELFNKWADEITDELKVKIAKAESTPEKPISHKDVKMTGSYRNAVYNVRHALIRNEPIGADDTFAKIYKLNKEYRHKDDTSKVSKVANEKVSAADIGLRPADVQGSINSVVQDAKKANKDGKLTDEDIKWFQGFVSEKLAEVYQTVSSELDKLIKQRAEQPAEKKTGTEG